MNSMKFNKIFSAILIAGIVAALSGFIAEKAVPAAEPEEDAYVIEAAQANASSAKVKKPAGPEPILSMLADADIVRGQKISRACAACHNFEKGGPNGVGPNLWGVVGRDKGAHAGFAYSDGMKAKGGVWSYDQLNQFLWKPKAFVAGTKMTFIGLKKAKDRAAVIAWLRTLSDAPLALPKADGEEHENKGDSEE